MAQIDHTVHVALGERAYDILIGPKLIEEAGAILAERFPGRRYGIVTDETVAAAQLPRLTAGLDAAGLSYDTIVLPAGESTKSYGMLEKVVEGLLSAKLERGDLVVALGGGVVGDLIQGEHAELHPVQAQDWPFA